MKKSTWFLLAAVVVVAIVTFLVTNKGTPPAPKKLEVAGYAKPEELDAERARGMLEGPLFIPHPVDEIALERDGVAMRFVRVGDAKDEQATWKVVAPVEAVGVKYALEQIVQVFKTKTASRESKVFKEADAKRFGFEPGRKIRLTLKSQGAVWNGVDWYVGDVRKGDRAGAEGADADTWVMAAGDATTVYAIGGKDLRTPCDKGLDELRDKKVFDFKAEAVSEIGVTTPGGEKIVMKGETVEVPPAPEAPPGPDGKPAAATKKTTWTLVEPAGVKGDASMDAYARAIAGLTVTAFVALDKQSDEAKKALAGPVWTVSVKVGDKVSVLKLQDGGKDAIWGQIGGKNEVFSVADWAAKGVRKGLEELEDRTVLNVAPDALTALTLKTDGGPVTITRTAGAWAFTAPALPYPADPAALLAQLGKVTAVRWAKKDEVEEARKALAAPEIEASLQVGETVHALHFGPLITGLTADAGGGAGQNRWAVVGDVTSGKPFLIQDFGAKRYSTTTDALRLKRLLGKAKEDIQQLTVQLAGSEEVATLERPSTGGELALVAMPAGKKANEGVIRTLLSTVTALDAKAFFDAKKPAEVGLAAGKATKIGLRLADGTAVTVWLSAEQAGDNAVYAMIDQGPLANVVVSINEFQAKSLSKKPDELVESGPAAANP